MSIEKAGKRIVISKLLQCRDIIEMRHLLKRLVDKITSRRRCICDYSLLAF